MPEENQINRCAESARSHRREAEAASGHRRLRAAEAGLEQAGRVAAEAARFKADREGQRNLATLIKELEALRFRGLRETAQQLAAIAEDATAEAARRAKALGALRQFLHKYGLTPQALGLNGTILNG